MSPSIHSTTDFASTAAPKAPRRRRHHCAALDIKTLDQAGNRQRRRNPLKRYTAGPFRAFLERFHTLPARVIPQRAFVRETYHTVLQILSDRLYPVHLTETLPGLPIDNRPTAARIARWWQQFRLWLHRLSPAQRTALENQTVLWRAAAWEGTDEQ